MRRRGHASELQGDEKGEHGQSADERGLPGPCAEREDPAADRARQARARVVEEEVERAGLRLGRLGPQTHPARSDRMAAEETDRHKADTEDRERQAIRQGEEHADRHEGDGEADDAAPAIASGEFAHQGRGDRADEIDAIDEANRRLGSEKRAAPQAESRCNCRSRRRRPSAGSPGRTDTGGPGR